MPPLNGFVSELLVYLGLLRTVAPQPTPTWPLAALAAPALAMIGALAVACFVKVLGAVFLGSGRTARTGHAHEAPGSMLGPMAVLAGLCLLIGVGPAVFAAPLARAVAVASPETETGPTLASLVPFGWLTATGLALLILTGGLWGTCGWLVRRQAIRRTGTWDCGYARPTARIQYTASSFAQFLVGIFSWFLRPQVHSPQVTGAFPGSTRFASHVPDLALDRWLLPMAQAAERWLGAFRRLQQGLAQSYLLYLLAAVLAMMVWTMPLAQIMKRWFSR